MQGYWSGTNPLVKQIIYRNLNELSYEFKTTNKLFFLKEALISMLLALLEATVIIVTSASQFSIKTGSVSRDGKTKLCLESSSLFSVLQRAKYTIEIGKSKYFCLRYYICNLWSSWITRQHSCSNQYYRTKSLSLFVYGLEDRSLTFTF